MYGIIGVLLAVIQELSLYFVSNNDEPYLWNYCVFILPQAADSYDICEHTYYFMPLIVSYRDPQNIIINIILLFITTYHKLYDVYQQ